MTRQFILMALMVISATCIQHADAVVDKKPNIVFILIDDLGWADLACYGNKFNETPNIDRLAKQGTRFTDFYASCPVCTPTRASIQTGQYQNRIQLTNFIPGHWRPFERVIEPEIAPFMPLDVVTVAEALKPAGYTTGYFGKWHLGPRTHNPDRQGYDESIVTGGRHFYPRFRTTPKVEIEDGTYLADFLTDQTTKFIRKHHDKPFFVTLSHYAVHIPLEAKQKTIEYFRNKPKPEEGVNNPVYAAMLAHIDDSVGKVIATLKELGIDDNTMVVFTSDNGGLYKRYDGGGEAASTNAPLRDEKGSLYEGGIRVPLIIRYPRLTQPNTICETPTISNDFYPTFLQLAQTQHPDNHILDGRSLIPLLKNPNVQFDRSLYFHYPHYHHSRPASVIRRGPYKLIEFFDDNTLELYNLREDISEKHNIAAEHPKLALELYHDLNQWRQSTNALRPIPNPKYDPRRADEWWSRRSGKPLDREALKRAFDQPQNNSGK